MVEGARKHLRDATGCFGGRLKWSLHPQIFAIQHKLGAVTTRRIKVIWESNDSPVRLDLEFTSKSQQPSHLSFLFKEIAVGEPVFFTNFHLLLANPPTIFHRRRHRVPAANSADLLVVTCQSEYERLHHGKQSANPPCARLPDRR